MKKAEINPCNKKINPFQPKVHFSVPFICFIIIIINRQLILHT